MADLLTSLLSYNNTATQDATNVGSTNVNSKSYTDKSTDFSDILANANKNYPKSTVVDAKKQVLKQDTSSSKVNDNNHKVENSTSKVKNHSQDDHEPSQKIDTNKKYDNVHKNYVSKDGSDNKVQDKSTNLSKNNDVVNNDNNDETNNTDVNDKSDDSNASTNAEQDQTGNSQIDSSPINQMSPLSPITAIAAALLPASPGENDNQDTTDTEQNTSHDNKINQVDTPKLPDTNIGVDLTMVSNEKPKDIQNDSAKESTRIKVQPKTEQLLLNLSEKDDSQNSIPAAQADKNIQNQTPVVQASSDVVAKAINDNTPKQSIKEVLEKAALSQDILDKTNARVVSIETTNSSSNNLLNQNNAQEQSAKFAFETNNNVINNNFINVADTTNQVNFSKTLDNAQQPKEISHTEIISQINSKLSEVKDDSTTKVTIVLKPENLGKINLEMVNGKDGFTASLTAESPQVKELLDKNLEGLRNTLSSQGVNVNNVTVKVAETQRQSSDMFAFDQQQQQGQNNQQSSNNSQQNQGNSRYDQEFFTAGDSAIGVEEPVTTVSHDGQVDYKI